MRRDGSWRTRCRATCRNATLFSAAGSVRRRPRSALNVTSNDHWRVCSISPCWRLIVTQVVADRPRLARETRSSLVTGACWCAIRIVSTTMTVWRPGHVAHAGRTVRSVRGPTLRRTVRPWVSSKASKPCASLCQAGLGSLACQWAWMAWYAFVWLACKAQRASPPGACIRAAIAV
jgi:hypothetical protein